MTASASATAAAAGSFPKTPAWQFWFVNHVYTNTFFVPTQYGFADAAALLDIPVPKWGGSASTSSVSQMVSFLQTAISAKANGIATTVINATGFTTPVMDAMNAGIPVVTYNADGVYSSNGTPDIGTNRLCYVGQALYLSGQQLGERIKSLVTTPGEIVIFIATPGTGNIQPRYDGAASVLKAAGYTVSEIATGAATSVELAAEKAYLLGHKSIKGAFAVDAGSTEFLAQSLSGSGLSSLPAGGFDLTPVTLTRDPVRRDQLHHQPEPVPAGVLAHAVPVHVQPVRRAGSPAGHRHRPELRHQDQRRPVPGRVQPVRGFDHGRRRSSRCRPGPSTTRSPPPAPDRDQRWHARRRRAPDRDRVRGRPSAWAGPG